MKRTAQGKTESDQEQPPAVEYLMPSEAARLLHVSPKTLDRWADQGWVPCMVTLGGHRRFLRGDVEALAREMTGEGTPAPK